MRPEIILHQTTGQPASCLRGLVQYAWRVAFSFKAGEFADGQAFRAWIYKQPVKLDLGEGPTVAGCEPEQRSRQWPTDGYDCWEATAHYVGIAIRRKLDGEIHIYDAVINGQRHVFPAWRPIGSRAAPQPLILQPPLLPTVGGLKPLRQAAQAIAVPDPLRLLYHEELLPHETYRDGLSSVDNTFRRTQKSSWQVAPLPERVRALLPPFWHTDGYLAALSTGGWYWVYRSLEGGIRHIYLFAVEDPGGGTAYSAPGAPPGAAPSGGGSAGAPPAQAWYNDLFGGVHVVGDKVLRIWGAGAASDAIASAAGPALPDWARTPEQLAAQNPPPPPIPPPAVKQTVVNDISAGTSEVTVITPEPESGEELPARSHRRRR